MCLGKRMQNTFIQNYSICEYLICNKILNTDAMHSHGRGKGSHSENQFISMVSYLASPLEYRRTTWFHFCTSVIFTWSDSAIFLGLQGYLLMSGYTDVQMAAL